MKKRLITALFVGISALPAVLFAQIRYVPPYPIFHQMSSVQSGTGYPIMLSPNGGEFWRIGETRLLSWSANGCNTFYGSCSYDLYLISSGCYDVANCGVNPIPLERNIKTVAGNWKVGMTIDGSYVQGVYKMAVCASGSYILCDVSDGTFTVNGPVSGGGGTGGGGGGGGSGSSSTITYLSPASGSTIPVAEQLFTWNSVSGASEYWVQFGTSQGGNDIYSNTTGSNTSIRLYRFPTNVSKMHLRLWYRVNNTWAYRDFFYYLSSLSGGTGNQGGNPWGTAGSISYVYPTAGSTLPSSNVLFVWNSVPYASSYRVQLGASKGSGETFDRNVGNALFANVSGLPTDGRTVYMRISYLVFDNWYYNDFTYQASNVQNALSIILRTTISVGQPVTAPATIPLEANVVSNNAVSYVDFFDGDYHLGQDTTAPYSLTAANVGAGTHIFTAVVTDSRSQRLTSAPLYVYVGALNTLNPILQITPQTNFYRAPAMVVLSLNNNFDPNLVGKVIFYQNGAAVDEDRTYPYQYVNSLGAGNYNFAANVYNAAGTLLGTSNQVSITVAY
ncbi:MAG: Ig-like domain-containing protein [Candidatus Taylorbacteria bacterium]|nr:Ig-like domain-containing protein [Candidatus Taylorbacteria bacterium]